MTLEGPQPIDEYLPGSDAYAAFFRSVPLNGTTRQIILAHYAAPDQYARYAEIAELLNVSRETVGSSYGHLGGAFCRYLAGSAPDAATAIEALAKSKTNIKSGVFVRFGRQQGHWHAMLRPQVCAAITSLGWDREALSLYGTKWEDKVGASACLSYSEGREVERLYIERARNPQARQACLSHYGHVCAACENDFAALYGERGKAAIDVHHLKPMSGQLAGEYEIDPLADLQPLCANCHRMVHQGRLITAEELKVILRS